MQMGIICLLAKLCIIKGVRLHQDPFYHHTGITISVLLFPPKMALVARGDEIRAYGLKITLKLTPEGV